MNLKLKLVVSFLVLALIGLGFSIATIYESSIDAFWQHDRDNISEWATNLKREPALVQILPQDQYIIFKQSQDRGIEDILNRDNLDVSKSFPYPAQPEGNRISISGTDYTWVTLDQPGDNSRLVVLHKMPAYGFQEFLHRYGTEIFIIVAFTLWGVFWAALVVYSLIQKIDGQKVILEKQTRELDKKHQDAIDAARTKSQFLANISHEMRTPLTAIIGYSETLLHSDQPMEERLSSINTVIRNGNHLLTLINDLLDLSKIEAGKLEVEAIPVNIIQVLNDVEQLFSQQAKAKAKGIELKLNYHFPLAKTITSDPVRIKQIVINLVSNALKFTKSGYIHLDVRQIKNDKLQIQVEDTGVGMTEQQISRIFEDYSQAEKSTSRKYGGTGLGLSLSKQLAQLLGGNIEVSSLPGLGSIFTLTVDCGDTGNVEQINSIEEAGISDKVQVEAPISHKLKGRMLLAEDNPDNQHLFSMYLKRFGVDLDIAHNGQQAIEFALRDNYDLILMDMQMPIMDGIEATRDLRNKGVQTPIVALTANAMKDDMDRFYSAGCDDYLTKPIKREILYQLCSTYLKAVTESDQLEPIISKVLEEDPDFIDIVSRFVGRLPGLIQNIQALNQQQNFTELAKVVHDLKGVSGNMGYQQISELAGKMEFQIANRNGAETQYLISQLEILNTRIQEGIKQSA